MSGRMLIVAFQVIASSAVLWGCGGGEESSPQGAQVPAPNGESKPGMTTPEEATLESELVAPDGADEPGAAEPASVSDTIDLWTYGRLLTALVTEDGLVRYELLDEPVAEEALEAVVRFFAEAPLPGGEEERIALWCNAYNANVLLAVARERRREGFESVAKAPGFFDRRLITVAGEALTLNDLENARIRGAGDGRVHAALVRGAMGGPPLRNEPYVAERIDEQLDDQCVRWINDAAAFRMVDGEAGLSEVLEWCAGDFDAEPYGGVLGFVLAYADPGGALARYIVNADRPRWRWIPFDWRLNQAPQSGSGL